MKAKWMILSVGLHYIPITIIIGSATKIGWRSGIAAIALIVSAVLTTLGFIREQ
jgi:hypothetical protein